MRMNRRPVIATRHRPCLRWNDGWYNDAGLTARGTGQVCEYQVGGASTQAGLWQRPYFLAQSRGICDQAYQQAIANPINTVEKISRCHPFMTVV